MLSRNEFKFGDVVNATRKQVGITQYDLCKRMGISQSNLSKIEANTLKPTADVWIEFCDHFSIPVDSYKTGYVDLVDKKILKDFQDTKKKLPEEIHPYQENAFLKIRFIIPILENIKMLFGEDTFYLAISQMGLLPHQIHNRDTIVNFSFIRDLLDRFELSIEALEFDKIAEMAKHDFVHGKYWNKININDSNRIISYFVKKIELYLDGYFVKQDIYSNSQVKLEIPPFPSRPSFLKDVSLVEKINYIYLPSFVKALVNNCAQVQYVDEGPSFQIYIKGI